ncbi:MAG: site-specific DNA-methyltransferase [Alphaproteobacteria bacterium]|nr:site-specific DNA-methyltransferase [Alphaproteobacteria bacterium]
MSARIIVGDAVDALRELPDQSVDLIIADPPYGQTSLPWDRWVGGWPDQCRRLLKPAGSMWVFGTQRMFLSRAAEFARWHLAQDVVWEKHNGTGLFNDRFRRVHESILHFYPKGQSWRDTYREPQFTNDATARTIRKKARPAHWQGKTGPTVYQSEDGGPRLMRSVIFARSEHGRAMHPTQKPIKIVEPILLYSCPPGGTVLDPFAGSGTTGVAAKRNAREAILIEISPEYADIARRRIESDAPLLQPAEVD